MAQEILVWTNGALQEHVSPDDALRILTAAREAQASEQASQEAGAKASAKGAESSAATHSAIVPAEARSQALVWQDIEGDIQPYSAELVRLYGLTPLTLSSLADEHAITKLREARDYFHIVLHAVTYDSQTDTATVPRLDIVFGPHFVVTLHCDPMPWLADLRESIVGGTLEENVMSRSMSYLLYVLLDSLVDSYFPVLDVLDDEIDDLEDATVTQTSNAVQARLFRIKREVALMRRVISPQVELCNALITRTGEVIPEPMEPYFATVHDHMIRAFDVLDSYRDLLSGLLDVYLTTVSNRLNVIMKQLTIIATIFLPISFVTGVFGQNFGIMPQVAHDNGYFFWYALLFMALVSGVQLFYFWRRGWL